MICLLSWTHVIQVNKRMTYYENVSSRTPTSTEPIEKLQPCHNSAKCWCFHDVKAYEYYSVFSTCSMLNTNSTPIASGTSKAYSIL